MRRQQQGLSLIEVLISLVVVAIGLLGVAGLQATASQANYIAYQYSMAARLAENLAESMRANRVGLLENAYELGLGNTPSAPPVDCARATCTPGQLGRWQLADWHAMLAPPTTPHGTTQPSLMNALPRAMASVTCEAPCTDRSLRLITILWDATRSGATGTGCNPDNPNDLQCLRLIALP